MTDGNGQEHKNTSLAQEQLESIVKTMAASGREEMLKLRDQIDMLVKAADTEGVRLVEAISRYGGLVEEIIQFKRIIDDSARPLTVKFERPVIDMPKAQRLPRPKDKPHDPDRIPFDHVDRNPPGD